MPIYYAYNSFTNVPVYYLKKEVSENKMKEKCLCVSWGGGGSTLVYIFIVYIWLVKPVIHVYP